MPPAIEVSEIVTCSNDNSLSFRLPIKLKVRNRIVDTEALLDSGAEGVFIDRSLAKENWIQTFPLSQHIIPRNVDGTTNKAGNITRYAKIDLQIGQCQTKEKFLVTDLGKNQVILGLPWLRRHNPRIDWRQRMVELHDRTTEDYQVDAKEAIVNELSIASQGFSAVKLAAEAAAKHQDKRPVEEMVPKQYHKWLDVFSKKAAERFPPSRPYDHAIELKPSFVAKTGKVIHLPPDQQAECDKFIEENLKKGYIRRSKSPNSAPLFFIKKKDGSWRSIQDYRYLNSHTVKNGYPMRMTDELIAKLQKAKWFTTLDLRAGYNNLRIRDGDQWKAAFICNRGLFEPMVMFFGLCNSPATFQAFMDDIFRIEIIDDVVVIYMDDILIFAESLEELRAKTEAVLQKLKENDLFCKPEKCHFEMQKVSYLGFIITPGHVQMDPVKIDGVDRWQPPKKPRDVQQFLGFANFYRRFIDHYAEITRPLDKLRSKNEKWNWTDECQRAFDLLKKKFLEKPVLMIPDKNKPFILETDASEVASGAVLRQYDNNGDLKPCGYISRAFSPTEQRYQIYDRELLAIIRALIVWRPYLQGSPHPVRV